MERSEHNKAILKKYIPEPAVDVIAGWIYHYDFKLKIRRSRSTKLGDYRAPLNNRNHQITVNHDLNQYAFLITLVHEVAHLTNWNKHQHRVKPHGNEWKQEFKLLMQPFFEMNLFPEDVHAALRRYLLDPAASSCSDHHLMRVLKKYDHRSGGLLLENLPENSVFIFNKTRRFIKGKKVRTRFKCMELTTKRLFLFSPLAEVEREAVTKLP